jgi:hypothetical protein
MVFLTLKSKAQSFKHGENNNNYSTTTITPPPTTFFFSPNSLSIAIALSIYTWV